MQNIKKLYMDAIAKYDVLTQEEETELAEKMRQGDEDAREQLINHNLKLVVSIALKFKTNQPLIDLIGYGNEGLITALSKYDPKLGRVSTYATPYIWRDINNGLQQDRNLIRRPKDHLDSMATIAKAVQIATQKYGKEPTPEEVSEVLGGSIPPEKVQYLIKIMALTPVRLDAKIGDTETSVSFADIVPDSAPTPDEQLEVRARNQALKQAVQQLPKLEQRILYYKFYTNLTLPEMAKELAKEGFTNARGEIVSKQYISLVYLGAIKKLKKNTALKKIILKGEY